MAVTLNVVEDSIERVSAAIKKQREEHVKLAEVQGTYDLAQEETQESLQDLRSTLDKVDG